jgi:hypothetical protein
MAAVQLAPSVLVLAEQLDGRLVGAGDRGARHKQRRAQRAKEHGTHDTTMASISLARGATHGALLFLARALTTFGVCSS